jgi:hypothetical protein
MMPSAGHRLHGEVCVLGEIHWHGYERIMPIMEWTFKHCVLHVLVLDQKERRMNFKKRVII